MARVGRYTEAIYTRTPSHHPGGCSQCISPAIRPNDATGDVGLGLGCDEAEMALCTASASMRCRSSSAPKRLAVAAKGFRIAAADRGASRGGEGRRPGLRARALSICARSGRETVATPLHGSPQPAWLSSRESRKGGKARAMATDEEETKQETKQQGDEEETKSKKKKKVRASSPVRCRPRDQLAPASTLAPVVPCQVESYMCGVG